MNTTALTLMLLLMLAMTVGPMVATPISIGAAESGQRRAIAAREAAAAMAVQQQYLVDYALKTGATGVVSPSQIGAPAPWGTTPTRALPGVHSVIGSNGATTVAVTYYSGGPYRAGDIEAALLDLYAYSADVGWTNGSSSQLVSPQSSVAPVYLPPALGIPANVPALADVVK